MEQYRLRQPAGAQSACRAHRGRWASARKAACEGRHAALRRVRGLGAPLGAALQVCGVARQGAERGRAGQGSGRGSASGAERGRAGQSAAGQAGGARQGRQGTAGLELPQQQAGLASEDVDVDIMLPLEQTRWRVAHRAEQRARAERVLQALLVHPAVERAQQLPRRGGRCAEGERTCAARGGGRAS